MMDSNPWTHDLTRAARVSSIKITTDEALSMWRKEANDIPEQRRRSNNLLKPQNQFADADTAADQIIEELSKFHIAAIGIAPMKSLLRNKNGRYGDLIVGVTTLTELDKALAE